MERSAVAWLVLAAVLWGTTGTAQALGEADGSPLTVGAVRLAIGSIGLLVFGVRSMARPPLRWLAVGSLAMAAYQVAFFSGVARAGVALGTVVAIGSSPVVAGILGWLSRGEVPNRRWWLATGLAVAGVALIAGRPDQIDLTGVGLALTAGVAYAVTTLASKHLLDVMTPTAAMAAMFGVAAVLLAPLLPGADLEWITRPKGLAAALWLWSHDRLLHCLRPGSTACPRRGGLHPSSGRARNRHPAWRCDPDGAATRGGHLRGRSGGRRPAGAVGSSAGPSDHSLTSQDSSAHSASISSGSTGT